MHRARKREQWETESKIDRRKRYNKREQERDSKGDIEEERDKKKREIKNMRERNNKRETDQER